MQPARKSWVAVAAAIAVMLSLGLNLALLKGGSYLATPIPGVRFPDLLFFTGALVGIFESRRTRYRQPRGIWILVTITAIYVFIVSFRAQQAGLETILVLRDSAFFIYVLALPGVIYLVQLIGSRGVVLVLRISTGILAIWVGVTFAGWNSAEFGSQFSENLFSINADMAGIVLAIGILSWSNQFGWRQVWIVQAIMLFVGLQSQSRVGAASVVVVWVITIVGLKPIKSKFFFAGLGLAVILITAVSSNYLAGQEVNRWTESALPGLSRIIPSNETGRGTAGARFDTWSAVWQSVERENAVILGRGPGSNALAEACSGLCPVAGGVRDLRYPHNIELSILLYHGLVGLLLFGVWTIYLLIFGWARRPQVTQWVPPTLLFGAAQVGVVLESPFGLVPFVFFAAWALSMKQTATRLPLNFGFHH